MDSPECTRDDVVDIDNGIVHQMRKIWSKGIKTRFCCMGHAIVEPQEDGNDAVGVSMPYVMFDTEGMTLESYQQLLDAIIDVADNIEQYIGVDSFSHLPEFEKDLDKSYKLQYRFVSIEVNPVSITLSAYPSVAKVSIIGMLMFEALSAALPEVSYLDGCDTREEMLSRVQYALDTNSCIFNSYVTFKCSTDNRETGELCLLSNGDIVTYTIMTAVDEYNYIHCEVLRNINKILDACIIAAVYGMYIMYEHKLYYQEDDKEPRYLIWRSDEGMFDTDAPALVRLLLMQGDACKETIAVFNLRGDCNQEY